MRGTDLRRAFAVLVSPIDTFRSVVARPSWWAPFLVLVLLGTVAVSIQAPKIDWQATIETKLELGDRQVESPEKLEIIWSFLDEYGTTMMVAGFLLAPWIMYPLLAVVFRSVLKRMGGDLSFQASLAVVVHGFMPFAVASLLAIPFLLGAESINLYDPGSVVLSLMAFAGDDPSLELLVLLGSIELFSLWTLALLVIGYSLAARVTRLRAAVCVFGLWALWVGLNVGLAALG